MAQRASERPRARGQARRFALLAITAAALAACNLIAGLGEDFTVDPKATGPGSEAGSDGPVSPDADRDGALPDGALPDATIDVTIPQPIANFCDGIDAAPPGDYCWDFEKAATPPDYGWNDSRIEKDASVAVLPDAGEVSSRGLEVYLAQSTASTSSTWLMKTLPSLGAANALHHYELAFDFNVVEVTDIFSGGVGMLTFPSGAAPTREYGVSQYEKGAKLSKLGSQDLEADLTKNTWYHAQIVLDRQSDASTLFDEKVTVGPLGGAAILIDTQTVDPATASATEVRLGVFSTAPQTGSMRVRFDNVLVRRW